MDRPLALINHQGGSEEDIYYHLMNERGDVYALTNRAGQVVERYRYSLYGELSVYPGDDYHSATPDELEQIS